MKYLGKNQICRIHKPFLMIYKEYMLPFPVSAQLKTHLHCSLECFGPLRFL